jgi:hypothetical protein
VLDSALPQVDIRAFWAQKLLKVIHLVDWSIGFRRLTGRHARCHLEIPGSRVSINILIYILISTNVSVFLNAEAQKKDDVKALAIAKKDCFM